MSDSVTLWTVVALQAPLSMGFSRQEYWSELPCPPPGELPAQGRNLCSPTCCTGRRVLHHWHRLGSSVGWRRRQLRRWWEVLGRKVSGQWDRGGMGVTAPRSLRMIQLQCRGPEGRTEKQSRGPRRTGRAGGGGVSKCEARGTGLRSPRRVGHAAVSWSPRGGWRQVIWTLIWMTI